MLFRLANRSSHQIFRKLQVRPNFGFCQSKDDLKLYLHIMSQPCRAVMALLALGNIPHQEIIVNLYENETKKP